jgi:hypothetical protein
VRTFDTPTSACPVCAHEFCCATNPNTGHRPKRDDLTICVACTAILLFNEDLTTRVATAADVEALELDTYVELQRVRSAILRLQVAHGSGS